MTDETVDRVIYWFGGGEIKQECEGRGGKRLENRMGRRPEDGEAWSWGERKMWDEEYEVKYHLLEFP